MPFSFSAAGTMPGQQTFATASVKVSGTQLHFTPQPRPAIYIHAFNCSGASLRGSPPTALRYFRVFIPVFYLVQHMSGPPAVRLRGHGVWHLLRGSGIKKTPLRRNGSTDINECSSMGVWIKASMLQLFPFSFPFSTDPRCGCVHMAAYDDSPTVWRAGIPHGSHMPHWVAHATCM